jgi:hypothetical protein
VPEKSKAVCELLGVDADDMSEQFHDFLDIAKRITDWQPADEAGNEEDEYGVAVDLEADEDENDGEGACSTSLLVALL